LTSRETIQPFTVVDLADLNAVLAAFGQVCP